MSRERRARPARRRRAPDDALRCAEALDAVARSLRAGLSLSAALDTAVTSVEFPTALDTAVESHRRGSALSDALAAAHDQVADTADPGALHVTLSVLGVAARHGGRSAEALDRTAAALRERSALAQDARAHAASARLSATVLTAVPMAFSGFAVVADGRVRLVLLTTPLGWSCVVVGLGLNLLGRRWMARIVRGVDTTAGWVS